MVGNFLVFSFFCKSILLFFRNNMFHHKNILYARAGERNSVLPVVNVIREKKMRSVVKNEQNILFYLMRPVTFREGFSRDRLRTTTHDILFSRIYIYLLPIHAYSSGPPGENGTMRWPLNEFEFPSAA